MCQQEWNEVYLFIFQFSCPILVRNKLPPKKFQHKLLRLNNSKISETQVAISATLNVKESNHNRHHDRHPYNHHSHHDDDGLQEVHDWQRVHERRFSTRSPASVEILRMSKDGKFFHLLISPWSDRD